MFYFYLVDNKATHHHLYWTHLPIFWGILYASSVILAFALRRKSIRIASSALCLGVLIHLLLDTPVGGIAWLSPFSHELISFIEVPAVRSWWVWNFILHWTFCIEIFICTTALYLFLKKPNNKNKMDERCTR